MNRSQFVRVVARPLPAIGAGRRLAPVIRIQVRAVAVIGALAFVLFYAPWNVAHAAESASPAFRSFVGSLWPQASRMGVSRKTFEAAFAGVTPDPAVLAKTKSQAEFVKPVWDYLASAVSSKRIDTGRQKLTEAKPVLARIERAYGVDPYIVLGVWGLESNFGRNVGDTSVIRDLATLAYARYRGDYFRHELLIALKILQEGHVSVGAMQGSWAGAMGQTQFMPSSFMRYAVDFDGGRRKNIWTSAPDALASTANFLARHGWVRGWTWGYEVIPPGSGFLVAGRTLPFASWSAEGYRRADGFQMPREGRASLLLPAGSNGPAFLVTKNFKVIKSYNNSTAYALGVALLSDRIAGAPALKGTWPNQDIPTASIAR